MRTILICSLLLIPAIAAAQESVTLHIDYSAGSPVVVNREYRDFGYIYIRNGSRGVLEMGPPQYSGRAYGYTDFNYRSHRYYGRAYRGYNRNR